MKVRIDIYLSLVLVICLSVITGQLILAETINRKAILLAIAGAVCATVLARKKIVVIGCGVALLGIRCALALVATHNQKFGIPIVLSLAVYIALSQSKESRQWNDPDYGLEAYSGIYMALDAAILLGIAVIWGAINHFRR